MLLKKENQVNPVLGLSLFDEASDFHVCVVIRQGDAHQNPISGTEFRKAFTENWLRLLPKPVTIPL